MTRRTCLRPLRGGTNFSTPSLNRMRPTLSLLRMAEKASTEAISAASSRLDWATEPNNPEPLRSTSSITVSSRSSTNFLMNHPFIKKFVEERELTVMLLVDLSGSGLFGSVAQSKRELAAEIASVLAFSAIRNNDKAGLILFSEGVEKFIPPRKGRKHVLRVIREILFYEPRRRGTDLNTTLEFMMRVLPHRAIVVILSDFLGQTAPTRPEIDAHLRRKAVLSETLGQASFTVLRQANRRHDVVAVQITDRYELELPALGRLILKDAETGEVVEVNTGDARRRAAFAQRQARSQAELLKLFRSARIDSIQLRTDEAYAGALGR